MAEKPKIDLLKQKYDLGKPQTSPFLYFGKKLLAVGVIAITVASVFSYRVSSTSESMDGGDQSLFTTIKQFVQSADRSLEGEQDDRVNVLLLGVGGYGHDGPQLSDTVIFASYRPSTEQVALMSLPRDMTVPIPEYGYRKVNHANAYGELEEKGYGPILASRVIGAVLDQDIQYYLRVDFDGFAQFINDIGGVDIYVDNAFTDSEYPTRGREYDTCGYDESTREVLTQAAEIFSDETIVEETPAPDYSCRFETLTFREGWTHMDGETALKYVRSRHGNNGEGSDFARSRRQQNILLAVKDKVFSASTFFNPNRIKRMLKTLDDNIATNMSVWEIASLAKMFKDLKQEQVVHHVIDASEPSPLYATILNGAYVLLPKNDDWGELQSIAQQIWIPREQQTHYAATSESDKPLFVRVEIQNGTNMTGLAFRTSQLLDGQGFDVVKVGNAASRGYEHTVIYDLTNGQRAEELKTLQDFLKADVTLSATGWMVSGSIVPKDISVKSDDYRTLASEPVDFLVILGKNSSGLSRF